MNESENACSRRRFLKTALVAPAGLAAVPALPVWAADAPAAAPAAASPLPTRKLGRNGPEVSMISLGGNMPAHSASFLEFAWSMGVRYFDTAATYGNGNDEGHIAQFLKHHPERRKEMFLVTKDHPRRGPQDLLEMVDKRLAACGTDYLDAFYIHGLGPREYGDDAMSWPKSDEFKTTAEKLKKSGKVKMVGFSCHDGQINEALQAAAEGGFLDIIMVAYTPFFKRGDGFDTGLEACHKKGIALVAMKTLRNTGDVPKRLPEFDKLGLTTHQALLHAVWSDPRISAVCNRAENVNHVEASVAAARSYKTPLKLSQIETLRSTILASRQTFCPGCPSCQEAARRTELAFLDIARFVTYYEQDGHLEAREMYQALPESARRAAGVDLSELSRGCAFGVDYAAVLRNAERYFI